VIPQARVYLRRVDPDASPPVLVAARLTAEFGAGPQVQLVDRPTLLRVTSDQQDLAERIAALLAEPRFDGWAIVDLPSGS
jgi:hypothetical protein